jgi:hypothetical protein
MISICVEITLFRIGDYLCVMAWHGMACPAILNPDQTFFFFEIINLGANKFLSVEKLLLQILSMIIFGTIISKI